jgi:hypothetical protein
MSKIRIQAQYLQVGDVVGSGEKVEAVRSAGLDLPTGKAMIVLSKGSMSRTSYWGKYTYVGVNRAEKVEE